MALKIDPKTGKFEEINLSAAPAPTQSRFAPPSTTPPPKPPGSDTLLGGTRFGQFVRKVGGAVGDVVKKEAKFAWNNPGTAAKNVGEAITSSERAFSQDILQTGTLLLSEGMIDKANNEAFSQSQAQQQKVLDQIKRTTDPARRNSLAKLLKTTQPTTINTMEDYSVLNKTPLQIVGDAVGVALDVATLGYAKGGEESFKLLLKSPIAKPAILDVIKEPLWKSLVKTAAIGGAYGATNAVQQGETSIKEIGKSAAIGAVAGGALDIGARFAGKVVSDTIDLVKSAVSSVYKKDVTAGVDTALHTELKANAKDSPVISASLQDVFRHYNVDLAALDKKEILNNPDKEAAYAADMVIKKMSPEAKSAIMKEVKVVAAEGGSERDRLSNAIASVLKLPGTRDMAPTLAKYTDSVLGVVNPEVTKVEGELDKLPEKIDARSKAQDIRASIEAESARFAKQSGDKPADLGSTLHMSVVPGVENIGKEIVGAAETVKKDVTAAVDEIRTIVSPSKKGEDTKQTADLLRNLLSEDVNSRTIERLQSKKVESSFNKLSKEEQLQMIDNYEKTGSFGPGFENYDKFYKQSTDEAHQILSEVYKSGESTVAYVDNYVRHAFRFKSNADESAFVSGYAKSLNRASKSVLKKRTFETLKDAMTYMDEKGIKYEVVTTNPETLRQWTINNARSANFFKQTFKVMKDNELVRFARPGDIGPGEVKLNDRAMQVFFPTDKGIAQGGSYVAQKDVATLLNNAVSKGLLDQSAIARLVSDMNNTLNGIQLGFSAFHFLTETVGSSAMELAGAIQDVASGRFRSAAKKTFNAATVFKAPLDAWIRGNKLIKGVSQGLDDAIKFVENYINPAGGRLNIENRYRTQRWEKLTEDLKGRMVGSAVKDVVPALAEKISAPLMENFVPKVKVGMFMQRANEALDKATKGFTQQITDEQKNRILQNEWDRIDDVLGQMVQDNLFWNKTHKDVANLAFRSFGWTGGTIRLAKTAVADVLTTRARFARGEQIVSPAIATVIAYPAMAAWMGGIYYYMHTGQAPKTALDYFFPLENKDDPNSRRSLPGYMKDVFSYKNNPVKTLINKLSPEFNLATELITNKDYYGVMIRDSNDPLSKQLVDVGKYLADKMLPFSVRNLSLVEQQAQSEGRTTTLKDYVESSLGISKAPNYITETKAQQAIFSEVDRLFGGKTLTKQEGAASQAKAAYRRKVQAGIATNADLQALIQQGYVSGRGVSRFSSEAKLSSDIRAFQALPKDSQQRVVQFMSPDEKAKYKKYAKQGVKF